MSMDTLITTMLPKLLGPHMGPVMDQLQAALNDFNALKDQMDRIENLLVSLASGGHSLSERIEGGLGIIQDIKPEPSIGEMLAQIQQHGELANAPGNNHYGTPSPLGSDNRSGS